MPANPGVPPSIPVTDASGAPVPSFMCIVYVKPIGAGRVRLRVANFGDIEITASSQRDGLTKILPLAKKFVASHFARTGELPSIDPPKEKEPDEQRRILPAHL